MVRVYLTIILFCVFLRTYSQIDSIEYVKYSDEVIVGSTLPEYWPVYQLGNQQGELIPLCYLLSDYIEIPVGLCDSTRKQVWIQFSVETNCEIRNIKILKGLNAKMDREAVRVIKLLRCVRPAITRGKPVKYQETIPVIFCKDKKTVDALVEQPVVMPVYKIPRKWRRYYLSYC